jgi:uncharacterized protein YciI
MAEKQHFVVELTRTGAPTPQDIQDQQDFLANLAEEGSLILSGPLSDTPGRGMAILRAASRDEVNAVYQRVPFIARGLATYEVRALDAKYGTALK